MIEPLEGRQLLSVTVLSQAPHTLYPDGIGFFADTSLAHTEVTLAWKGGPMIDLPQTGHTAPPAKGFAVKGDTTDVRSLTYTSWIPWSYGGGWLPDSYSQHLDPRLVVTNGDSYSITLPHTGGSFNTEFQTINLTRPGEGYLVDLITVTTNARPNMSAVAASVPVEGSTPVTVTVTDSAGAPVVGVAVQAAPTGRVPLRESLGVGLLALDQPSAMTNEQGVATFTIRGKKTGNVSIKFTVPSLAGEATQNYTVTPQYLNKLWPLAKPSGLVDDIWNQLKSSIDASDLSKTIGELEKVAGTFLPDDLTKTFQDYLKGKISEKIDAIFAAAIHLDDSTKKTGWIPEHFQSAGLPDVHQQIQGITVLGIGGTLEFKTRTLSHDDELTWKQFILAADYNITVDPQVLGFKGTISVNGELDFGTRRIEASGGTVHP